LKDLPEKTRGGRKETLVREVEMAGHAREDEREVEMAGHAREDERG
jgi:hypothetical protein